MFDSSPMKRIQFSSGRQTMQARMRQSVPQTTPKTHRLRHSVVPRDNRLMTGGGGTTAEGFYENRLFKQVCTFQKTPESIFSNKKVIDNTVNGYKSVR